ncbi:hypothetical protein AB0F52_44235 [Amycolatopsis sp. NPDC024027]|uniref:hypothetical protein n=1 Tax=Amycolatopsis sp. NPDC024027 TaxID=3154327 RepID=UPI0033EEDFE7
MGLWRIPRRNPDNAVPDFRSLLQIDVIESAQTAPHLLSQIPERLDRLVRIGLADVDLDRESAVGHQYTGDGQSFAFSSRQLGQVVDLAYVLAELVFDYNKWYKPELRLRIAVEVGPLPAKPGLYPSNISCNRLLESPQFKKLALRCAKERLGSSMSIALIISNTTHRTIFSGNHTKLAKRRDFAQLAVAFKEFEDTSWVSVPGFDAYSLGKLIAEGAAYDAPP